MRTLIASLINGWIQKEPEKKKLGNEVLLLYQEVNLIFNFSEKLAQTIGQSNIAHHHTGRSAEADQIGPRIDCFVE